MSGLLEILGRAVNIEIAELIWHWLDTVVPRRHASLAGQYHQLQQILELIENRKLHTAEEQLRIYLFQYPACVYGRMAAAALALQDSRLREAITQLDSVYFRQPNNTMALYALGHCYERLGYEPQAVEFYQDCLKFKSYLQLPAQRLAAIYFKNGQIEKAIQQYKLLRSEYPGDLATLLTLGQLYTAAGKYPQAIDAFNNAILMHPDNNYLPDEQIEQFLQQDRLDEALERCEYLCQQYPDRADLLLKRAEILTRLGATSEALAQYKQTLQLSPDFLEAVIKLGTLYLQLSQPELAAEQFNKAVELNDRIVDAYLGLATAQKLAGHTSDATGTLSLAGAIAPNSAILLAETAALQLQLKLQHFDHQSFDSDEQLIHKAIAAHRYQLRQQPNDPQLHYRLGILLSAAQRLPEAIESFNHALTLNPWFERARAKLAICLYETGQIDQALDQLLDPARLDSRTLQLHYRLALLYCNPTKFAGSLLNLEKTLTTNLASTDATDNIATVLQNLALLDRATAMWEGLAETAAYAFGQDGSNQP